MARYSDEELHQLKMSIDLVGLIRSKGIELQNHGKDLRGLCPFHADTNPSMIITPDKNLFHCPSCGTGGDVITFISKYDKLSFRNAVDFLMEGGLKDLMVTSPLYQVGIKIEWPSSLKEKFNYFFGISDLFLKV